MSAKLKRYGFMLIGVIATFHIGSSFIKPLVVPDDRIKKEKANQEYLDSLKRI